MANITYTNADKNFRSFGNSNSITMDRNRLAILQMMQKNPEMTTGYLIGNAIGKKYWGDKQAKSRAEANFMVLHPDATRDQFNQYYKAIKSGKSRNDALAEIGLPPMREYGAGNTGAVNELGANAAPVEGAFDARNNALEAYKNGAGIGADATTGVYGLNGRVVADPKGYYGLSANTPVAAPAAANIPRTPQQSGQVPVTTKNAGLIGGMVDPQKAYQAMENKSTYNPGNTPTAKADYNGVRNQGSIIDTGSNIPVADALPPMPTIHGGVPSGQGGGGAELASFAPVPEVAEAAPNLAVDNNPYADYGYGVNNESDFNNGGLLSQLAEYLLKSKFTNVF